MRLGTYELEAEIGRGGMGVVYRARAATGQRVAVKLLQKLDPEPLARFAREQRLGAALGEAEGFVPLLDQGVSDQGPYLVMPFLPGGTLDDRLRRGPLSIDETLALAEALATALGRAHERGIVHRDVKPANVLFTAEGRPLLADLGLAKHFRGDVAGATFTGELTRSRVFQGTGGYMPLEQMRDARSAGPPADVFALGAVLYECLAGRPAFSGSVFLEIVAKVETGSYLPLSRVRPEVPRWLERVIVRALAPEPGARFPDGHALARAVEARGEAERAEETTSRRGTALGVALIAGLLLVSVVLGLLVVPLLRDAPTPPGSHELAGGPLPGSRPPGGQGPDAPVRAPTVPPRGGEPHAGGGPTAGAPPSLPGAPPATPPRPPAVDPATHALAKRQLEAALARAKAGQLDAGIAGFTRAIELDPGYADAYYDRALARSGRDPSGALVDFARAAELDPRCRDAWYSMGVLLEAQGDHPAAVRAFDRAIEVDPTSSASWLDRGLAREAAGDTQGAFADLERALALDADDPLHWYNRGVLREAHGQPEGAIEDYERCLALSPSPTVRESARSRLGRLRPLPAAPADARSPTSRDARPPGGKRP